MINIVILGAGRLGGAIAKVLTPSCEIALWDAVPGLVKNQKELEEIIPSADFIFLCIPTSALFPAIGGFKDLLNDESIIISVSKGVDSKTLKTPDKILKEALPSGIKSAHLGGPMMAEEIMKGLGGFGLLATEDEATYKKVYDLFHGPHIHLEYSNDPYSVVMSGVLKNIYAVGLGIAAGLGWGGNSRGWLTVLVIGEMREAMKILGANPEEVLGLAGLGDIITTGFSEYSSNYKSGKAIIKGEVKDIKSEGFLAFPLVIKLLGKNSQKLPFLTVLKHIIIEGKDPKLAFDTFRPK